MATVTGPGATSVLDGPTANFFQGDTWELPLTWWQTPPVYGSDGVTVVTPGVPVNMTGLTAGAELYINGVPGSTPLTV